jgi:hypothetical protein
MYGSDLLVPNPSERPLTVIVRKKDEDRSLVAGVENNHRELEWTTSGNDVVFNDTIPAGGEGQYAVRYTPPPARPASDRPIRFEATVAARRILSEFRDEYWQKYVRR